AAEVLRELEQRGERMYPTLREPSLSTAPAPLAPIKPDALLAVLRKFVTEARATQIELPGISRVSVDECRARILDALRSSTIVSFRDIAGHNVDEVIAAFLAILELFRRGMIVIEQPEPFSDLVLSSHALSP